MYINVWRILIKRAFKCYIFLMENKTCRYVCWTSTYSTHMVTIASNSVLNTDSPGFHVISLVRPVPLRTHIGIRLLDVDVHQVSAHEWGMNWVEWSWNRYYNGHTNLGYLWKIFIITRFKITFTKSYLNHSIFCFVSTNSVLSSLSFCGDSNEITRV